MRYIYKAVTASPAGTATLGRKLARELVAGDCVILWGEMGVGKTCFAGGIAQGLGIATQLISPTFNICREYQGRLPLQHFDLYRLQGDIWDETGLDESWSAGVRLVEWAPAELLGESAMLILQIEFIDGRHRRLSLTSPRELTLPRTWKKRFVEAELS